MQRAFAEGRCSFTQSLTSLRTRPFLAPYSVFASIVRYLLRKVTPCQSSLCGPAGLFWRCLKEQVLSQSVIQMSLTNYYSRFCTSVQWMTNLPNFPQTLSHVDMGWDGCQLLRAEPGIDQADVGTVPWERDGWNLFFTWANVFKSLDVRSSVLRFQIYPGEKELANNLKFLKIH